MRSALRWVVAAAFTAGALVLSGCSGDLSGEAAGTTREATGKVRVVAAENVWGNIAAQIGGDRVTVTSIINSPNTDPHEYETSARDAATIADAALVIENGVGYDSFVDKLLAASADRDRAVLRIADVVHPRGHNPNPHLWYDPGYVAQAARAIDAQLAKQEPTHAASFTANLNRFLAGEQQVVDVIDQIKTRHAGDEIAYTERVPGYLVQAAGLKLGVPASFALAIEDGTAPSPADNVAFQSALQQHRVKVLLYNSQVTSPATRHLRELAEHHHVAVVGVSETMPADAANFQNWQADQARALLAALGG